MVVRAGVGEDVLPDPRGGRRAREEKRGSREEKEGRGRGSSRYRP